jgi:cyclohexa-1,5-dienecarbonyl-CoA hydratase
VTSPAATSVVRSWFDRDGDRAGRLLRIRLARPPGNVLDAELVAGLDAALATAAQEQEREQGQEQGQDGDGGRRLHAVLLDADGPNFSFGASVAEHLPEAVAGMLAGFHALVLRLVAFPVPVLVAVRGACLGGGLEVAAAGTRLFATADAKLGQPEIALGVFAPAASCLLPERIGRGAADDLLLTGRTVTGEQAHRIGLVDEVADDPTEAALAYADRYLLTTSAVALRQAVTAARGDYVQRIRARLAQVERQYLDELMASRDATEGLVAFLEKRAPRWEDR